MISPRGRNLPPTRPASGMKPGAGAGGLITGPRAGNHGPFGENKKICPNGPWCHCLCHGSAAQPRRQPVAAGLPVAVGPLGEVEEALHVADARHQPERDPDRAAAGQAGQFQVVVYRPQVAPAELAPTLGLSAVSTRRDRGRNGYASPTRRHAPVAFWVKMTAYSS